MQKDLRRSRLPAAADRTGAGAEVVDTTVAIAGEPTKGSPTAKVTLVEVSDYHCPFCRRHMQTTQPQIDADYINTGKVQYVFIDYPIEQLHPEAFKAHEAANCAGDQGKYWEMHARLFATRRRGSSASSSHRRRQLGIDARQLKACLDGGKYAEASARQRRAHATARRRQHADVPRRPHARRRASR